MQKSSRTRRARTRQTGSSIPVRVSSNEQTRKTVHSARSDGHGSGGEFSSTGNSNNVETSRTVYSARSDGHGSDGEFSSTGNVESARTVYSALSDGSGREHSSMSNSNNMETEKVICTSRSAASDGEITTVRQTFRIVGTIDKDNRCSMESLDSNRDSAFHGSQDFICQQDNDSDYSEVKMIKTVSFEDVGSNDGKLWIKPSDDIKAELEQEVGEDEELLREELLRIFDRERFTLGNFFKNKMEDIARDYRKREMDLEEHSRAEIADIENEVSEEKSDMQNVFANEIATLTRTFNDDRASMEQFHKQQIKELREQFENDQKAREHKFAREKGEFQEKLESDFQAMLRAEIEETKQSTMQELEGREDNFNTAKIEMERRHSVQLSESEMNTKKVKDELEMMFSHEKARLEEDLVDRINELEQQLQQEREMRIQLQALLQEEKLNATNLESAKRRENEHFKFELDGLRLELDEKNKVAMEMSKFEKDVRVKGKDGLNGKLREDFDKILEEHKQELERKYVMDKEELQKDKDRQLQEEKKKIQNDVEYERKKMKEDIEKERKDSITGNWEGMKQSQDYPLRRSSTERNEYSASISYGNQEQQRINQYSKEDGRYGDKGVDQLSRENERKDGYNSTMNPRQDGSYGDRGDRYNTRENKDYSSPYNQPKEPKTGQSQYRDPDNRDNLIYCETSILEQMQPNCQSQYKEIFSERPSQGGQQEQRTSQYNPTQKDGDFSQPLHQEQHISQYNPTHKDGDFSKPLNQEQHTSQYNPTHKDGDFSKPLNQEQHTSQYNPTHKDGDFSQPLHQEQRGSQYNPYTREDSRHPSSPSHVQQPEQVRSQHDSSHKRIGNEPDAQPQRNDQGYISSRHSKDQILSSADPKSDLYYVTPGNENSLRDDINELRGENEGLKAKIEAMEENIDLHKKYKAEAKEELSRLQKTKDELQSKINDTSKGQEDGKRNKGKVDKLEKSLRESESRRKEFEAKVRELNNKLSDAEEKAQQAKDKANDLEDKIREHSGTQADKGSTKYSERPDPSRSDRYSKDIDAYPSSTKYSDGKRPDLSRSDRYSKDTDAYPSSTKYSERPDPSRSDRYSKDTDAYPSSTKYSDGIRPDPSRSDRYGADAGTYPRSTKYADDKHQGPVSSDRYGKESDSYPSSTKYADSKREDPTKSERYSKHDSYPSNTKYPDSKHENVYGYPAELSQSFDVQDYKKPQDSGTTTRHLTIDEPQSSWKNPESKRGKCTKCSPYSSKSKPTTTRPEVSSLSSPHPIYGSHERLGKSSDKQGEKYKPGSFGGANERGFNTSSPRKLDGYSYENQGVSAPNDDNLTKKETYDKAIAERDKLEQLIKELKDKVEELYVEKERIDKEQSKLRKDPISYHVCNDVSSNQSDLKSQVEDMQRKIRALADRLKSDGQKKQFSYTDNGTYRTKPSMQDIEHLQDKLQRTGDAISHTNDNLDPDALRRIEKEIKAIGELMKSHFSEDDQGCSTYRSEDTARVLQLQMDKQELERKLSMAKDVMNDYVNRLSEKMGNLEGANAISDATLHELYERNAKLKEALKALENGQKRSEVQNEQLRHEKSALQNVIGKICKSEDASCCSQYSTPRQSGNCCHDGSYGYTMTSHGQYKVPELDLSDRFSCY